jgi:hypothetical protein
MRGGNSTLRSLKTTWDIKAGTDERPPRRAAIPFDAGRRGVNDVRPIDSDKAESGVSYPGFWPRSLAGAGPLFLLGVALLCTFYLGPNNKKPTAANREREQQLRSDPTSQPSSAVQSPAKPSPTFPAVTARSEGSIRPERPANPASSFPGFKAVYDHPKKYEATHKKAFGGCTGQLELTSAALHFRCAHQADLDIPVSSIARTHEDGVVLASGEKYHFLIANHTKGQVETIFNLWLSRVRQSHQASRESSF